MQQAANLTSSSAATVPKRDSGFFLDVISGLSQQHKRLSPKYFYDRQGSKYFDRICTLDEYYPFQAELELLPQVADQLTPTLAGDYAMIEFGAGSLLKVKPLLDCISGIRSFTPIDISGDHLHSACEQLKAEYPALQVQPVVADFSRPVELSTGEHSRLGFFPGSTIGNFSPDQAREFLASAGQTLGRSSYLLIGVDTKKSPSMLHAAYNDSQGVTALFNRNILERINRELNGRFDVEAFDHYAFYNAALGRIEMHLVSRRDQRVSIGDIDIPFAKGESIHTESSYKYSVAEFTRLGQSAGWHLERHWLANEELFAIYLLRYEP